MSSINKPSIDNIPPIQMARLWQNAVTER